MSASCPNCLATLVKVPTRKTKCPSCGLPIYVKATPNNRTKQLMTEAQANATEQAWSEKGLRDMWEGAAQSVGIKPAGTKAQTKTRLIDLAMNPANADHSRKMAATTLRAHFSETAEERFGWETLVQRMELDECAKSKVGTDVVIRTDDPNCPRCAALKDRRLKVQTAIAKMPLPDPKCPRLIDGRGACRCWYRLVIPGWPPTI